MRRISDPVPPPSPDRAGVDWPRYVSGFAVAALGSLALLGVAGGLLSQVVLFGDYDQRVEAEIYGPLVLPCLVALAVAGAGGAAWWSAFVRGTRPRRAVAPFLAASAVCLVVAAAVMGPTEGDLQRRWTGKIARLRLPDTFTPVQVRPGELGTARYELARRWASAQEPDAACASVQQAMSAWLGGTVEQRGAEGTCYLSAVDGGDEVTATFDRPAETPGQAFLTVRLAYAL